MAAGMIVVLTIGAIGTLTYIRNPRLTPELRGFELAGELGCFACHGPGATGGVPNPGSDEQVIPAWDGGNAMMYVNNEQEIEEWILFGHPERLNHKHESPSDSGSLPLQMPAFEGVISDDELQDLVAYYKAVAAFEALPPDALIALASDQLGRPAAAGKRRAFPNSFFLKKDRYVRCK